MRKATERYRLVPTFLKTNAAAHARQHHQLPLGYIHIDVPQVVLLRVANLYPVNLFHLDCYTNCFNQFTVQRYDYFSLDNELFVIFLMEGNQIGG